MRRLVLVFWAACAVRAATLTISPPLIFDCQDGAAVAQISWSGASGPVAVRINAPDGAVVTGFGDPSGSVTAAGPWITDGMKFFLVNQAGVAEATAVAHISCGSTVRTIDVGLQGGSYFPLQVGNTWVYRVNSRIGTAYYVTRFISGTDTIGDKTYYVLSQSFPDVDTPTVVAKLRGDNSGVIWTATPTGDQKYLGDGQAITYQGPLGTFNDAISIVDTSGGLTRSTSVFVRGIGLAHLDSALLTGSSGGFDQSYELVEARFEGVSLAVPAATISVSIETTDLDVTDQLVPNCALPCYFAACGLGGGQPDPAGTYRPCVQARVEATADPGAQIQLQLIDAGGSVLFTDSKPADATGKAFRYVRLPVYISSTTSNAFQILGGGQYRVAGRVLAGGAEVASSNINVRVR
jgi:hypothetical protein